LNGAADEKELIYETCNNFGKKNTYSRHPELPSTFEPFITKPPNNKPSNNLLTNQRPRPKRSSTAVSLPLLATLLERLDILDFGSYNIIKKKSAIPYLPLPPISPPSYNTTIRISQRLTFFAIQPILTLRIRDFVAAHGRAG
jgi:hypothetical protein